MLDVEGAARHLGYDDEDILAAVEAAAACGDGGAERLLWRLLDDEERSGGLGVMSRLVAARYAQTRGDPPGADAAVQARSAAAITGRGTRTRLTRVGTR